MTSFRLIKGVFDSLEKMSVNKKDKGVPLQDKKAPNCLPYPLGCDDWDCNVM